MKKAPDSIHIRCAAMLIISGIYLAAPCLAYIPDVGPGVCVSSAEECAGAYSSSSSSSDSYSSSSSSSSDYGSGGYYNSYDAMAMNTAMGLMGSFMSAVSAGMEKAAAQQAEYDRQMAEQQRIEAELARQEQERLRAEKIAKQQILRADYQAKMTKSSATIRAGITRIEGMLGLNSSPDTGSLKIETLDDINPGGVDWDGRQGGGAGSGKPLELMRDDDFVDSNVVDLRDKTDLTVRPELVSAMPGQVPESAQAQVQPAYEALVSAEPSMTEQTDPAAVEQTPAPQVEIPAAAEQDSAPEPNQPETFVEPAPAEALISEPLAEESPVVEEPALESPVVESLPPELPEVKPSDEQLTEHPSDFRQTDIPSGSQGYVELPPEAAGAQPYPPLLPWKPVPVQNSEVDPAVLKGDTPPIRPETVESLKEERAMGESFNAKSMQNVEEMRAEAQMQEIRKAAEKDLQEKAVLWRKRQALEKEAAELEQADIQKYPGLGEALDGARQEWAEAEKEYNEAKAKVAQQPAAVNDEFSSFLLELNQREPWPGPHNPEPPLANPVENEEEHYAGVLNVWRKRREAKE